MKTNKKHTAQSTTTNINNNDHIGKKEKFCFALMNLGNIPVTLVVSSFLLIFYTNVVGLNPAACATLFLIARIVDAVNDPVVGFLIDRVPNTKHGHFRMTLLIGAILCGLNYLLLWFGPMMLPAGKLAIAYISYLLLGVLFPVMDISLNSLLTVMTEDAQERNSLSTIKGLFYALGGLIIGISAPLIIGNDTSSPTGYIRLILIVTCIIIGCSVIGVLGVKERIVATPEQKYKLKDLFGILKQKPVLAFFATTLIFGIANYIYMTTNTYYYVYILGNLSLYSIASLLSIVGMLPGVVISGILTKKFGKKMVYIFGLLCFGVVPLIRLLSVTNVPLVFIGTFLMNFGMGIMTPHMYSILADNTDYVEIQTGFRAEAAVASLSSFVSKFSMGIGGAIPGYLLALVGFDQNAAVQNSGVNQIIILCVIVLPAILSAIAALILGVFYPLNKQKLEEQTAKMKKLHNTAV